MLTIYTPIDLMMTISFSRRRSLCEGFGEGFDEVLPATYLTAELLIEGVRRQVLPVITSCS